MICYSIEDAVKLKMFDEVMVSTDSREYAVVEYSHLQKP